MVFESSFEVRAGEDELDLDLPLAVIEGRILDPHGAPLAGIRVHARDARVSAERARITSPSSGVLTQAAGRYALRGVPTDVELVVDAGGRGYQPGTSEVVRVAADGIRSGVDLTLARGADLDVLVRGPEGARANWRVEASPATELDDPTWTQETNSLGRASFAALAPGRWHVRVAAAGDDPGEVFAQEQIVDVALDQPNDVVFRVD